MSFIYAEKKTFNEDSFHYNSVYIFSDTKIIIDDNQSANWSKRTLDAVSKYGLIKSVNISSSCNVSFAGNNIIHANRLLSEYSTGKIKTTDEILNRAVEIHLNAPTDEIEFLICYCDDNKELHIVCIKDKKVDRDCNSAWIGSYIAFNYMQKIRFQENCPLSDKKNVSSNLFRKAIEDCGDTTVGGFVVGASYYRESDSFEYIDTFYTANDIPQTVNLGESVKFYMSAEKGTFTFECYPVDIGYIINIKENGVSILYTRCYRFIWISNTVSCNI